MTQEEKAKAYDEALEKAKKELKQDLHESGVWAIQRIFPGLKESEDERIRKSILHKMKACQKQSNFFSKEEIAYLEKQKEYVADSSKTSSNEDKRIRKELVAYIKGELAPGQELIKQWITYLEKQKELPFVKDVILGLPGLYFYDGERMHFRGNPAIEEKQKEHFRDDMKKVEQKPKCTAYLDLSSNEFEACMLRYLQSAANRKDDLEIMQDTKEYAAQLIEITRKEQKPVEPSDDELQRYQDELYNFKVFAAKQAKEHHISFVHDFEWNNFCAELLSYFNEQKPVEYLSKDKVYAIMNKLTNLSYSALIPPFTDEYKKINEITSDVRSLLDYPIEQKPDIELIQRSWYMEGYHDREFNKEPKWIIKTGKGGPKHELNPKYGEYIKKEQKPAEVDESTKRLNDNWMKQHFDDYKERTSAEWAELQSEFKNINGAFEDGKKEVLAHPEKYGLCECEPAEWSEEDERILNDAIEHLKVAWCGCSWLPETLTWLKSLRPSWKPSEDEDSKNSK